ncbi:MAG: outer-membrane lipoprotein carrier protein LolA [SAR324 cluster bacterium]|nr:outer-membrane lipoprotein carrier protein LolA [SAR324 cluster bacterium]
MSDHHTVNLNRFGIKNIILMLFAVLSFQGLLAQTIDLSLLNRNLDKISALSGHFTQENFDLTQNRKSTASGRFFFLSPGLMQWIYEKPDPYSIIVGKERIWLYDPILENVTIYKTHNVNGIKIISLLFEPEKLQDQFKIIKPRKTLLDLDLGDKLLFLAHKTKDSNISEIQMSFDATYQRKQIVIVDLNLNYRKFTLSMLDSQPHLSVADFEFSPPDGVEIIDKTEDKFAQ